MTRRTPVHAEWLAAQRGDGDHGQAEAAPNAATIEALRERIAAMESRGRAGAAAPREPHDVGRIRTPDAVAEYLRELQMLQSLSSGSR